MEPWVEAGIAEARAELAGRGPHPEENPPIDPAWVVVGQPVAWRHDEDAEDLLSLGHPGRVVGGGPYDESMTAGDVFVEWADSPASPGGSSVVGLEDVTAITEAEYALRAVRLREDFRPSSRVPDRSAPERRVRDVPAARSPVSGPSGAQLAHETVSAQSEPGDSCGPAGLGPVCQADVRHLR